jgi:arylsulfatase A-like enzyme
MSSLSRSVRLLLVATLGLLCIIPARAADAPRRPNVLLIITDDQGYGDLGCHGNPKIKTPNLDRLASQSTQFPYFYVCPVCSPTRAGLMTGRYNYRTGIVDTFLGRSMMRPDEVTLAEMLAAGGYRTGIFGKWHLGDNYPLRPIDRGFQEALVCTGGGLTQPSDPPGNTYFDPILLHNGKQKKTKGYCTDVFTDAALEFLGREAEKPFFAYVAFNAPHTPLQVPDSYLEPYKKMNLAHSEFPSPGHPLPGKANEEVTARVYGMVTNIDDNVARLLAKLDELKIAGDTIVIFMTDNGPQQVRYNAGLRDRKGSVFEGGIRVPCYWRWPGKFRAGGKANTIAANIDVAPTLLEACGVAKPAKVRFDGLSLLPLLEGRRVEWPDRTLFFQWHRGDEPQRYRSCAARSQKWKLVQPLGSFDTKMPEKPEFMLFDMANDPLEMKDVAADHPDVVAKMRKAYEDWFTDVSAAGFAPPRVHLGAPQENPLTLTRQDWRGPMAGWGAKGLGYWEVHVSRSGNYDVTLRFPKLDAAAKVHFRLGEVEISDDVAVGKTSYTFAGVTLAEGPGRLEAWIAQGKESVGVHYVDVKRLE